MGGINEEYISFVCQLNKPLMTLPKETKIAIVGAGTFGLSTALYLSRQGYTDITCYDKDEVPSYYSAGNDSNKILDVGGGVDDEEDVRHQLELEAKHGWQTDPVFKPYCHPVGYFLATADPDLLNSFPQIKHWKKIHPEAKMITTPEEFKSYAPVLSGDLTGWCAYKLEDDDGWLHARDSLKSAYRACLKYGVKFVFNEDGEIVEFLTDGDKVTGIKAKSGKVFTAEEYVLTCGGNAPKVWDFKGQLQSKCWTVAHIQMTKEEVPSFKDSPIIYNVERGFFFEPDENDQLKICNEFPGYTMFNKAGESIPFWTDSIPLEAANWVREFLTDAFPEYADRPFVKTKICWCTDSPNREHIITEDPRYSNMIIGSGDSGKSFMLMPIIGKYIGKVVMDGTDSLTPRQRECWKWRPETSEDFDETQGRYGGSGKVQDLTSIKEWVSVENPEPHSIDLTKSK